MEISLFTPDELTNCTEYIYLYIAFERGRAPKEVDYFYYTRRRNARWNRSYICKEAIIDPYPKGGKKIIGRGGNKRIIFMLH